MSLTKKSQDLRAQGFGASEIAALVGLSFRTPIDVYADKVLGAKNDESSLPAELGELLEEPVAKIYSERTGSFLARVHTIQHPTKPLCIATPDRARFSTAEARGDSRRKIANLGEEDFDRLVEVKTTAGSNRHQYGPDGTDDVPEEKLIQCIWQMGAARGQGARVDLVDLPVLFRDDWGVEIRTYSVAFNEAVFDGLYQAAERFQCDHVLPKKPPPIDHSDRYADFLARAFPVHKPGSIVTADAYAEELMLRFAKIKAAKKRLDVMGKKTGAQLRALIGENEGLVSDRYGKLTFKKTKDSSKVRWKDAANDALLLAGLAINAMPEGDRRDQLAESAKGILPKHTKAIPGHRRFYPRWSGEADVALATLNLSLAALESKDEAEDEKTTPNPEEQQ